MKKISFVFFMIIVMSCKTNSEKNNIKTDIKMENLNKQLVLNVYSKVFGQGDFSFADSVISEDYIQHNPMVKTGKKGFMEFLTMLKQIPKPDNPKKPFLRLICDSNFVAVHSQVEFMGKDNAVVDLYRIENGLLVEHWDAVQEIVDSVPNVVGTIKVDDKEQTEVSKRIVKDFVNQVLINKQIDKSQNFLSDKLALADFELANDNFKLHRIIGEQNFVLTQSEVSANGIKLVQYDIFRLSNQLIVEHWRVKQVIPEKMVHSNGMI